MQESRRYTRDSRSWPFQNNTWLHTVAEGLLLQCILLSILVTKAYNDEVARNVAKQTVHKEFK